MKAFEKAYSKTYALFQREGFHINPVNSANRHGSIHINPISFKEHANENGVYRLLNDSGKLKLHRKCSSLTSHNSQKGMTAEKKEIMEIYAALNKLEKCVNNEKCGI